MRLIYIFILLSLTADCILPQNLKKQELDSLYNELIYLNSSRFNKNSIQSVQGETNYEKCGFGLVSTIAINFNQFTLQQQSDIKKILQRPVMQDSIITPDGYFKIHYDPAGINKPSYSGLSLNDCLDQISETLDSVYNFEIKYLGYLFPNANNSPYDIYISNSTSGSYGYTQPENSTGNGTYSSFIVIHNNYQNFATKGIDFKSMTSGKKISESIIIMTELVLPNHTNQLSKLLGSQLMHCIDICAALCASKHNHRICVTTSVDKIDFHHPVRLGDAVTLSASINRVFNTSMEVGVKVYAESLKRVQRSIPIPLI